MTIITNISDFNRIIAKVALTAKITLTDLKIYEVIKIYPVFVVFFQFLDWFNKLIGTWFKTQYIFANPII